MNVTDGLIVRNEVVVFDEIRSQRLWEGSVGQFEETTGKFHHRAGVKTRPLHLLRSVVVRHETATFFAIERLSRVNFLNLRMCDIESATINCRFAEHNVWNGKIVVLECVLNALEPHEIDDTRPIRETCHQTAATPFTNRVARKNLTHNLDIRHRGFDLVDAVDTSLIDILIRIVRQ